MCPQYYPTRQCRPHYHPHAVLLLTRLHYLRSHPEKERGSAHLQHLRVLRHHYLRLYNEQTPIFVLTERLRTKEWAVPEVTAITAGQDCITCA